METEKSVSGANTEVNVSCIPTHQRPTTSSSSDGSADRSGNASVGKLAQRSKTFNLSSLSEWCVRAHQRRTGGGKTVQVRFFMAKPRESPSEPIS